MKAVLFASVAATLTVLAACSSDTSDDAGQPVITAKSALARDTAPTLTADEQTALATGQADFAVSFYRAVATETAGQNVILSPHSASIALGMAYAGARTTTASEMRTALHLALPDERVHAGFNYLDLQLASRGQGATGQDGNPFQLKIANSIWAQTGLPFEQPFLDTLGVNYGAGVNLVDFEGTPDLSRVAINEWTEEKTANRIKELMKPGTVTSNTKLALVNAVYFNASWETKFTKEATLQKPFTRLDGSTLTVSMMHTATRAIPHAKGDGYEAIELPYEGGELSMLVIVPDAGKFSAFESSLTGASVLQIAKDLAPAQMYVGYPKHHFEGAYDLKATLQSLGMNVAFTDLADFSGLLKSEPLKVDKVLQKTFIDVDEAGTEAAAATVVSFADAGAIAGPPPAQLIIDRPFIEAIVDRKTQTLVFLGRILEPTAK